MWCGQCGSVLKSMGHGATQRCCDGTAYWSVNAPLAKDHWWPVLIVEGLFEYPTPDEIGLVVVNKIYLYHNGFKFHPKNAVIPKQMKR